MKEVNRKYIRLLILICIIPMMFTIVNATPATSYTYTFNSRDQFVRTQDAYLPDLTMTKLELKEPKDIFIDKNDILYIADTGNNRIVMYDINEDKVIMELKYENLLTPTGVYVTNDNELYVADASAGTIFVFSLQGELLNRFTRPTSISYGTRDFRPLKVSVDPAKNMFIIGEGVYDGIIQLSDAGEFLGYFTSNKVNLSLEQRLQDLFFTEEQKALLLGRTPTTFSNIFIDNNGIVYSTTMGSNENAIKKHNTAGQNMFKNGTVSTDDITDIYVDNKGIIYVSMKSGLIAVYTTEGEFIHIFGGWNAEQDISGLYSSLASLAVDSKGTIWTIDEDKSFVQSFMPTEYALMIYNAIDLFNQGLYQNAIEIWNEVLRLNQMSVLAHNNIGKNYLYNQEYDKAMVHSRIAGSRYFYSQAYWEVRNIWLQKNLGTILIILISLIGLNKLVKFIDKKTGILNVPRTIKKKITNIKLVDDISFMFNFIRHPINSFYDLKLGIRGSAIGATIIYILFFIIYIWSNIGKGFIYQFTEIEDIDFNALTLGFFAITFLFIFCNYLVSSINDGEGTFGQLYKMFMYAMGPLIISLVLVTILSHYLTYNESFILQLMSIIGVVWSGVYILIGIQETHNYLTRDAIKSILMTLLFMVVIAVMLLIVIIMWEQVVQFFEAIIKEGYRNVFNKVSSF